MYFEPPAPLLRVALRERCGLVVSETVAEAAIRAEIAYYRAHLHEGTDPSSLADLRARCAAAMAAVKATSSATRALTQASLSSQNSETVGA